MRLLDQIFSGGVGHGQLLPGHAGNEGQVAPPGVQGQQLAVGIVKLERGVGALRPGDVPQVPAFA